MDFLTCFFTLVINVYQEGKNFLFFCLFNYFLRFFLIFSVFLQYIERGIFLLNVEFVESVICNLDPHCEEDILFKYELLSHLNQREESLRIMQNHDEYVEYLLQYHLSKVPIKTPSKISQPANLESTSTTPFIPRSLFLNAIRERYNTDSEEHRAVILLIENNYDLLYTHIIKFAEYITKNYSPPEK